MLGPSEFSYEEYVCTKKSVGTAWAEGDNVHFSCHSEMAGFDHFFHSNRPDPKFKIRSAATVTTVGSDKVSLSVNFA